MSVEIRCGQTWRRVKGVSKGRLVQVVWAGDWAVEWRGLSGGAGSLLRSDWFSRYELVSDGDGTRD